LLELQQSDDGRVEGGLGMEAGYALRITGSVGTTGNGLHFTPIGEGLDGTTTAGWRYDYRGVVRVKAHGPAAPAGYTASFIAVRHADNPPARTARPLSSLLR
jgi:hypothetical protein